MNIVIVLGYCVRDYNDTEALSELYGRVSIGVELIKKGLADVLVLSGGITSDKLGISEAKLMRDYAIKNEIEDNQIILEEQSLDTIGNAVFSRKIIDKLKEKETINTIYVISSCYHMERVKFIFKHCFGDRYKLNFEYCYPAENQEVASKESEKLIIAKNFFKDIKEGDIIAIENKLYTEHKLYKIKN